MGIAMGIETGIEASASATASAASICGSDMCLGNNKLTFCNKYLMTLICKIASRSKIGLALTDPGFLFSLHPQTPKTFHSFLLAAFLFFLQFALHGNSFGAVCIQCPG